MLDSNVNNLTVFEREKEVPGFRKVGERETALLKIISKSKEKDFLRLANKDTVKNPNEGITWRNSRKLTTIKNLKENQKEMQQSFNSTFYPMIPSKSLDTLHGHFFTQYQQVPFKNYEIQKELINNNAYGKAKE